MGLCEEEGKLDAGHGAEGRACRSRCLGWRLLARAVFGTKLCSVLLYGSAALRGTRPDSDLDLLLVTEREMTQDERLQMTGRLLALSGPVGCRDRRPMEVTVFSRRDLLQVRERPGGSISTGSGCGRSCCAVPCRSEARTARRHTPALAGGLLSCAGVGTSGRGVAAPIFQRGNRQGNGKEPCRSCCLF